MEKRGWTGYHPPGGMPPRKASHSRDVPDFTGMGHDDVQQLINELLAERIDAQNLAGWWKAEFFAGQTPDTMLTARHYRQVWFLPRHPSPTRAATSRTSST